jgi:hypothetical protein
MNIIKVLFLVVQLAVGKKTSIVDEIKLLREREASSQKHNSPIELSEESTPKGCGRNDRSASFLRPRDDGIGPDLPPPCRGQGLILRRDMGSVGVSSFQQVYGVLAADALGPRFAYYDEWPMAAGINFHHGLSNSTQVLTEASKFQSSQRQSHKISSFPVSLDKLKFSFLLFP